MVDVTVVGGSGFCTGLINALKIARSVRDEEGSADIFGKLMHNDGMIADLEKENIKTILDISKTNSKTVVIRPHGARPEIYDHISKKSLEFRDATCFFVKKVHQAGKEYSKQGYDVMIIGKKTHPEVDAFLGHVKNAIAIKSPSDIDKKKRYKKLCVVSQTTTLKENFDACVEIFKTLADDFVVVDTICPAAKNRQRDTEALSKKVDVMIIVGGKNSSNTLHLFDAAKNNCKTYHIEKADELKQEWFYGNKKAGLSAGASTPPWIIEKVVARIKEL